ncbi:TonB-dependent receptor [Alteromonadaceae bacterium BrNp21-10]|nr:TonB-dependent receptor [Alteromonadaceae bacterium BrNp21-10]
MNSISLTANKNFQVFIFFSILIAPTHGQEDALFTLSLEELLAVPVKSTSFFDETLLTTSYSVTPISRNDWQHMAVRNVGDVLNHMPATIAPLGFGQSRVAAIRGYFGFNSARGTAVRFDGVPLNRLREGNGLMSIDGIDINLLQSVEMIRGPGSSLHGNDAFHGVVSLQSRVMLNSGTELQLESGQLDHTALSVNHHLQLNDHGLSLGMAFRQIGDAEQPYTYRDNGQLIPSSRANKRTNKNLLAKYQYKASSDLNAHVTFLYVDFDAEQLPGIGDQASLGSQKAKDWSNYTDTMALLKTAVNYQLSAQRSVALDVYHWRYHDDYNADFREISSIGILEESERKELHTGLKLTHKYIVSDTSQWAVGYEYQALKLDSLINTVTPISQLTPIITEDAAGAGYERTLHSFLVDGRQSLNEKGLQLLYGLRIDHYNDLGTQWSPRIGLRQSISNNQSLHLIYGEAFRAPTLLEYFGGSQIRENPSLQPEILKNIELKYQIEIPHWLHTLSIYRNHWYEGIIASVEPQPDQPLMAQFQNSGDNEAIGIEIESKGHWRWLEISTAVSHHRSKNLDDDLEYDVFPKWMASINIGYHGDNWSVFSNNRYFRRSRTSFRSPAQNSVTYFGSDLVFSWKLQEKIKLSLNVKNIFDHQNSFPSSTGHADGLIDEARSISTTLHWQF